MSVCACCVPPLTVSDSLTNSIELQANGVSVLMLAPLLSLLPFSECLDFHSWGAWLQRRAMYTYIYKFYTCVYMHLSAYVLHMQMKHMYIIYTYIDLYIFIASASAGIVQQMGRPKHE